MNANRRLLTPILILLAATTATFSFMEVHWQWYTSCVPTRSAESLWHTPDPVRGYFSPRAVDDPATLQTELLFTPYEVVQVTIDGQRWRAWGRGVSHAEGVSVPYIYLHRTPAPGLHTACVTYFDFYSDELRRHEWAFCVPGEGITCER